MGEESTSEVTELLRAMAGGNLEVLGQIYSILYPELKAMAHSRVRHSGAGAILDTTALVHESYLRLVKSEKLDLGSRRHFMAYAAHVMRSVVIDFVRQTRAQRRGGDQLHVTLNTNLADSLGTSVNDIVLLDELLAELAKIDQRLVAVVEMRYFAALEIQQIADCLEVSERTVNRDLQRARLLLIDMRA